jgi:hypothetical protein
MRWIVLMACCAALAACGGSGPTGPRRSAIPVLVYRDVGASDFAHQMGRLRRAGYDTITLATFIRFLRGEPVALPPRPVLLTFDDGRGKLSGDADRVLRDQDLNAVLFVDAGRVEARDPGFLRWEQLAALQRSGRWDVQLESGSGKFLMRYGPKREDIGPFYAYRGTEEVLGGWRERVFGDLWWGQQQLAFHVPGYRPLAVAPPYGNYGQVRTNDPEIPRLLLARLHDTFQVVFTQDRPAVTTRGTGTDGRIGRLEITREHGDRDLDRLLRG